MITRRVQGAAAVAATVVIALNVPAAHAASTERPVRQVVTDGQSIQSAVDRAAPGGEIDIMPGTYTGSVQISTPGLILRGRGLPTVLLPGGDREENACAQAGNGICVTGTAARSVSGVQISGLAVTGFANNGVDADYTDQLRVTGVIARNNGGQGFSEEHSVRGVLQDDTAYGNHQAGILVTNTVTAEAGAIDTEGTRVTGDKLLDNRFGLVLRRVRDLSVENNTISANCGGVFVVGDENEPRAGDLGIVRNFVIANNKHCAAADDLPAIQGTGILLTGTEQARVAGNQVIDNIGTGPMSGGIVLYRNDAGARDADNAFDSNISYGNAPADLAVSDGKATGNTFTTNMCGSTRPDTAGLCRH